MYTTYGINNKNDQDESGYTLDGILGEGNLASTNVIGKPVFSIPILGYIANFIQHPVGRYVAIVGCVLLVGITLITGMSDDSKKKKKGEPDEQADKEDVDSELPCSEEIPENIEESLAELKKEIAELTSKSETDGGDNDGAMTLTCQADGKTIVSASAGSGKTTVMIEKIIRLIQDGNRVDEILAVTFHKKFLPKL